MKVSAADVAEQVREEGPFAFRRRMLGAAAGAQKLGCSLMELPPGKVSWPSHYHLANEEAVYVLEGEAVLRLGSDEHVLRPGHYVALPKGPPARRLENRSDAPCRYLAVSTMIEPEVGIYPDSGKIGVFARKTEGFAELHERAAQVDYWKGEK